MDELAHSSRPYELDCAKNEQRDCRLDVAVDSILSTHRHQLFLLVASWMTVVVTHRLGRSHLCGYLATSFPHRLPCMIEYNGQVYPLCIYTVS